LTSMRLSGLLNLLRSSEFYLSLSLSPLLLLLLLPLPLKTQSCRIGHTTNIGRATFQIPWVHALVVHRICHIPFCHNLPFFFCFP
jgi:hypothetical protein